MLRFDVNSVAERVEDQLGILEEKLDMARVNINVAESYLNGKIKETKGLIKSMSRSKDVTVLPDIIDMMDNIKRIVDKLNGVDITSANEVEISLNELTSQEYERVEAMII